MNERQVTHIFLAGLMLFATTMAIAMYIQARGTGYAHIAVIAITVLFTIGIKVFMHYKL